MCVPLARWQHFQEETSVGFDAVPGKGAVSKDLLDTWDENYFLSSDRQTHDLASF